MGFQAAVIQTAAFAEEPLKKARDKVLSKAFLKELTADEAKAFKEWELCALDRLFFYREYNPLSPPSYLLGKRKGSDGKYLRREQIADAIVFSRI